MNSLLPLASEKEKPIFDINQIDQIDDIKRTGLLAGAKKCGLCGIPTHQRPLRMDLRFKGQEDEGSITGYFDDECANKIMATEKQSGFLKMFGW